MSGISRQMEVIAVIAQSSTKIMSMEKPFPGQEMLTPAIMPQVFLTQQSRRRPRMYRLPVSNTCRMFM